MILLIPDVLWKWLFFRPFSCTVGFIHMIPKKWLHGDKHFLVPMAKVSSTANIRFLKRSKLEANLINAMDSASVKLFSVTYMYLRLHIVRNLQTNCEAISPIHYMIMNLSLHGHLFWIMLKKPRVCKKAWKKPFQRMYGLSSNGRSHLIWVSGLS